MGRYCQVHAQGMKNELDYPEGSPRGEGLQEWGWRRGGQAGGSCPHPGENKGCPDCGVKCKQREGVT